VIETINGVGHPAWSIAQGGYTPGVATAPILLTVALYLALALSRTPRLVSPPLGVEMRQAGSEDAEAIAEAHRDSIRSIGPRFYPSEDVTAWAEGLSGAVYLEAMNNGEVFFIATEQIDGGTRVLGFASDYRVEGATHGTSVYVRGNVARRGIGTALLRLAEAHAAAADATSIRIEASLAGVAFYRANGYVEAGRGETRLMSGYPIACVFMRKEIGNDAAGEES
jgi:putative acetyltransferase